MPAFANPPGAASTHSQQLGLLKRQVERLTALVVQMLDVSRITGGGLELVPVPIDLRDVVRDVVDRFELEIQRRNVSVTVDAPDPVPARLGCRPRGSGRHQPAVECPQVWRRAAESPSAARRRALLVVQDHGVGIPEDEQDKVFGPFARATTARYHPGLGLGLWIAQQIVQASAGRISLDSRVEEGSTFTVELPR